MQTSIIENMALGIPGTHANTQPWFADPAVAATAVTFGGLAGVSSTGAIGAMDTTTYTTLAGIFVSPNEHVLYALPSQTRTLTVPAGEKVAVAKKGAWFVAQTTASTKFKKGDLLKVADAALATTTVAAGDAVLEVIDGTADDNVIVVRFL